MEADALLAGLDARQRAAVVSDALPLCLLAGAGSGKTRVLTRRIAYQVAIGHDDARHVLAVTFTRKAAAELTNRLSTLGLRDQPAAGTFHGLAYAQLRQRWADQRMTAPTLLERKAGLLGGLLRSVPRAARGFVQPSDLATEIEWAKARMINPSGYEAACATFERRPPVAADVMASIYAGYEREKKSRQLVDFDDLLVLCARAIEDDAEFAAALRWRYRHLYVDEFQDLNPLQFRLLEAWRGGRNDLCVVGDPNQAIFGWNGADATYLTGLAEYIPGTTTLRLRANYRSTPQILAMAEAVLGARLGGVGSGGPGVRTANAGFEATRPDGRVPMVRAYATDTEEATGIARAAREHRGPRGRWADIAVLVRTNAQSALFEQAFRAVGIPYRVRGGGALLDQPEVKAWLSETRRARPRRPLGVELTDLEARLDTANSGIDTVEMPDEEPEPEAGPHRPAGERAGATDRVENLAALARLGHDFLRLDADGDIEAFQSWLVATLRGDDDMRGTDAVEVVTFHRAKGAEWPVVFVAGLERGLVPHGQATGADARAEEIRLLYVALTRAERELHCSWAEERTVGARTGRRSPSPLLAVLEDTRAALLAGRGPRDMRSEVAAERARLAERRDRGGRSPRAAAPLDSPLLRALKEWRRASAAAASVPAYVIFNDATLAAVAQSRPGTLVQLLDVPGIGPVKAARYGEAVLGLVASFES